ncbi:MAG: hypothetical protein NVS1B4_26650 [Gemmatimonadaceae bacterium]
MRISRWIAAATLVAALVAREGGAQDLGIAVGTKAPPALVETLSGGPADIAAYVGRKPLLLEFWATWCSNCKELEPQMLAIQRKYAGKLNVVAVAVSFNQSPEKVKLYAQRHAYGYDVLYDRRGTATDAYSVPATSYVVVVDAKGTVVYTGQGGDQNLEAAVKRANP